MIRSLQSLLTLVTSSPSQSAFRPLLMIEIVLSFLVTTLGLWGGSWVNLERC